MKFLLTSLFISFFAISNLWGNAQKFTVSGNIKDAETGEDLIGAIIQVKELSNTGAITNVYGYYSLSLLPGKYTLVYSYLGYESQTVSIVLDRDIRKNVALKSTTQQLKGIDIVAERSDANVTSPEMSLTKVNLKEVEKIPVIFGEKDVMKTLQLLPGIKSEGDGGAGFFVRGGTVDQNLILLDEAPVYNASHMLGFFSVFNSDALKDVKLYKGGIPAQYGGRLSSVMDIKMKEGNNKSFHAQGGIGIIASKLTVEGPIVKDKGSFMVSARRTYADVFLALSTSEAQQNSKLYFYDFNAKANYQITENDRIYLSGYLGRDLFVFNDKFGFDWGNKTGTLRWNHVYGKKLFSNTSFIYNDYNYIFKASFNKKTIEAGSSIIDYNAKQDYQYFLNQKHRFSFGWNVIHHNFSPGNIIVDGEVLEDNTLENRYSIESAVYFSDDIQVNPFLSFNIGLRYSSFSQIGPGTIYYFDKSGTLTDTKVYDDWELVKNYNGPEPRISGAYIINPKSSVKASYGRTIQYLHKLSNSTSSTPTDVWLPSSNNMAPEMADQVALGYFRNFGKDMFEFSVETYFKKVQNAVDYRVGAEVNFNPYVESDLLYGEGKSYGIELLFKKRAGKFTGWLGYTLSRVEMQFDEINNGTPYPARQDRTHDLSVVGMYEITERLNVAATWVFYTGSAVTVPSGKYTIDNITTYYFTERNSYRMPNYHRLDVGVNWDSKNYKLVTDPNTGIVEKKPRRIKSSWNFSVYNAYGRENAYSISYAVSEDDPNKTVFTQMALFRWVPSITYNFSF